VFAHVAGLAATTRETRVGWRPANASEIAAPIAHPARCTGARSPSASSSAARSATIPSIVITRVFSDSPKPRWS